MQKNIPYGRQNIDEEDIAAVVNILRSPLITQGPVVEEFEQRVAEYAGTRYAVAFNSGTSALHGAMFAAGLKSGDEVISAPLTFVATTNAAVYMGARPVLVDVAADTYCIDPSCLEKAITSQTRAIAPIDYAGFPLAMDRIKAIADQYNLLVIEDAAHALGAMRQGVPVGSEADMTMFSFHPVKHITTGEGGMIVCNEEKYYQKLKIIRNHGIEREELRWENNDGPWYYEMQNLGYNYRLTDIQAALGISQFNKLSNFLQERRRIAAIYDELLADIPWLTIPPQPVRGNDHAYHLYPVLIDSNLRREFFIYMRAHNIGVQVHYIPVHWQPYYRQHYGYRRGDFPVAEDIYAREVSLPIYPGLSEADQAYVIETIKAFK